MHRTLIRTLAIAIYIIALAAFLPLCYMQQIPAAIACFAVLCAPAALMKMVEIEDHLEHRRRARGKHVRPRLGAY